ncbi:MAG: ribonuclease H-like domain-containing protein [Anaerocolumna sp.]
MQIIQTKLNLKLNYPIHKPYKREEVIFFDIETTGFLAASSYLYLIGAMYYQDDSWFLTQWFADDMQSEEKILEAFLSFLVSYKRIIHYNGTSFDLPYLDKKCKQYKIDNCLSSIESLDLYKKISSCKKLLPVPNLKLKTIETFAGIHREDKLSGEELIQIYANFIGKYQAEKLRKISEKEITPIPRYHKDVKTFEENMKSSSSTQLQSLLLLHNAEDVKGLLQICNVLYYTDLFDFANFNNTTYLEYTVSNDQRIQHILFQQELPYSFGNEVRIQAEIIPDAPETPLSLFLSGKELTISVPLYYGTLKYFPDNWKDYYYLPMEDIVVHKSVAQFVDKEFKQKVKAKDCYLTKEGSFLPLPTEHLLEPLHSFTTPLYQLHYKGKVSFSEYNLSTLLDTDVMVPYIKSLIGFMKSNGKIA